MMKHCTRCQYEFVPARSPACPKCGAIEGMEDVRRWGKYQCEPCDYAVWYEMGILASQRCPECNGWLQRVPHEPLRPEAPESPPTDDMVEVADRKVPFGAWEGEVMVRAAGWVSMVRGGGLVLSAMIGVAAAIVAGKEWLYGLPFLFVPLVMGSGLGWAGWAVFARRSESRGLLITVSIFLLLCPGSCFGISSIGRMGWKTVSLSAERFLPLILMPLFFLPDIFTLYAMFSKAGKRVFYEARSKESLAPLSSAWKGHVSLRALASVGIVCLACLASGGLVVGTFLLAVGVLK